MTPTFRTPIPQLVESKGQHSGSSNDSEKTVAAPDGEQPIPAVESIDEPPDGGYGWVCVACCFWINANTWGINSVSMTTRSSARNLTKDWILSRMVYFWPTTSQLPSIRARLIWSSPLLVVSLSRKPCSYRLLRPTLPGFMALGPPYFSVSSSKRLLSSAPRLLNKSGSSS